MADQQITDLPVATAADDADLLLIRQSLTDKQITKEILFENALAADQNLSDVPNKATARTNLDVPQIAAVCLKANNLSDVASVSSARQNLDLEIGVDVQAYSAELAALAANNTTPGLIVQTGTDTVASRTLTAPATGMTISNPTGAGGNPTFAFANDLGALEALASTGIAVRTGSDAWAQRTLQQPAAGLTITNPAGIAGDPTFAFANDLAALEALSSTGIAVRTGSDAWAQRTVTGTSNQVDVANGNGVSGNPTLSLPAQIILPSHATAGSISLREASANGTNILKIEAADNMASDMTLKMLDALPSRTNPLRLDASGNITASVPNEVWKGDVTPGSGNTTIIDVADISIETIKLAFWGYGGSSAIYRSANNVSLGLQFYESGAYITSGYNYSLTGIDSAGATINQSATSATSIMIQPAKSGQTLGITYMELYVHQSIIRGIIHVINMNGSFYTQHLALTAYPSSGLTPEGFKVIASDAGAVIGGDISVYSKFTHA